MTVGDNKDNAQIHGSVEQIMDPVTILSLIGTCTSIAKCIATASSGLNDILNKLHSANKSIARLAALVDLFGATVDEVQKWLDQHPTLSASLERTLKSSLTSCEVIVSDLEDHVLKIKPSGDDAAGLMRKIRLLWNEKMLNEHEKMISTQFQALQLIIILTKLQVSIYLHVKIGHDRPFILPYEALCGIGRSKHPPIREGETVPSFCGTLDDGRCNVQMDILPPIKGNVRGQNRYCECKEGISTPGGQAHLGLGCGTSEPGMSVASHLEKQQHQIWDRWNRSVAIKSSGYEPDPEIDDMTKERLINEDSIGAEDEDSNESDVSDQSSIRSTDS